MSDQSKFKGPWVRLNGNLIRVQRYANNRPDLYREYDQADGAHIRSVEELHPDAVPLVPAPDANDPEQCLFVSEVSRRLEPEVAEGYADWERGLTAREWAYRADRLEREQAEKAAHDELVVSLSDNGLHPADALELADILAARFNITPKDGRA